MKIISFLKNLSSDSQIQEEKTDQERSQRLHPKKENLEIYTFQIANNKCADQTAQMPRLICAFVVRKQQSQGFSSPGPYMMLKP